MRVQVTKLEAEPAPFCEALTRVHYSWEIQRLRCGNPAKFLHNGRFSCGIHAGRPSTQFVDPVPGVVLDLDDDGYTTVREAVN